MVKVLWADKDGRNVELIKSVELGYYINRIFLCKVHLVVLRVLSG